MLHSSSGGKGGDTYSNALDETSRTGPYFDKSASKNVTALLGKTTYLNCRVKNLGNKTVSKRLLILIQAHRSFIYQHITIVIREFSRSIVARVTVCMMGYCETQA